MREREREREREGSSLWCFETGVTVNGALVKAPSF
jgi:hypothetical protein